MAAVPRLVEVELVVERSLTPDSIPDLAMHRCALPIIAKQSTHCRGPA